MIVPRWLLIGIFLLLVALVTVEFLDTLAIDKLFRELRQTNRHVCVLQVGTQQTYVYGGMVQVSGFCKR
jgi:hypothetical protein